MEYLIAIVMIGLTSAVHAGAMLLAFRAIVWSHAPQSWRVHRVAMVVHVMAIASLIETMLWASVYVGMDVIDGFRKALYFSIVTYTTLGYGDISPVTGPAASLAYIQAIFRQFYVAIMVARVMGLYVANEANRD